MKLLVIRLLVAFLGGFPLLFIEEMGYVIGGVMLILAACFLIIFLERNALVGGDTADRMSFWFPFTISVELCLFANSCPPMWHFYPILICILGLLMPMSFLTKDHRHPSTW